MLCPYIVNAHEGGHAECYRDGTVGYHGSFLWPAVGVRS